MIENEIKNNKLFQEISPLLNEVGVLIVSIKKNVTNKYVNFVVIIALENGDATIDDCAKVYDLILPRLTVLEGTRNINLEVSTSGIQRVFHDFYEFVIFKGKRVRLYNRQLSNTITGVITEVNDGKVVLKDVYNEDQDKKLEEITVAFEDILKAKLDFKWEDVK